MHYTGTIWRPPYEAYSLLIQVTAGCTHHSCKFCTLYEELPFRFRMSPAEEVRADLKEAAGCVGRVERVFFTGGNPFALSVNRLTSLARMVQEHISTVKSIGCFARVTDITPKSVGELTALRQCGYNGLTIGVETGFDEALAFMKKGYRSEEIIEQCRKLEAAGISYNFFYLNGIAGRRKGKAAAVASAEVFNQLHPQIVDSSMLTVYSTSELYREIQQGNWEEETEIEKLEEMRTLISHLTVDAQFATDGASNLLQVRGHLLRDKRMMLDLLDQLIATLPEENLRAYRETLPHL